MVLRGFSYSKLTELQVQGARDRSQRQIESSQLINRLEQAKRKYKNTLQRLKDDDGNSNAVFQDAIRDVYEQQEPVREISPIMAARLAELCRREYTSKQFETSLDGMHEEQRSMTNYLCQEIDESQSKTKELKKELQDKIDSTKKEIERLRRQKIKELKDNLEWKKRELQKVRLSILEKIEDLEKKDWSQVQEPVMIKKCIEGTEWVDIDEDYFPTKGASSGWVLCS